MTVFEMLAAILKAYPGATPDALETHKPAFYARFGKREGPHLEAAFNETLATFVATTRQPFPIAANIEQHMPSMDRSKPEEKPLDIEGHTRRQKELLTEWRQAQAHRGANGVLEVLRALEHIALPLADLAAWNENPEPLRLSRAQLVLAQHRALSLERRTRRGVPPKSADEWWTQISAIAEQWGITTTLDQWSRTTTEREAARRCFT